MLVLTKLAHRFKVISIKIPTRFIVEIDKLSLNLYGISNEQNRIAKTTWKKRKNYKEFTLPDFKTLL